MTTLKVRCGFGEAGPEHCPAAATWRIRLDKRLWDCCDEHAALIIRLLPPSTTVDDLTGAGRVYTRTVEREKCQCGWELPLSVFTFPNSLAPDEETTDNMIKGCHVALVCPRCGRGHGFYSEEGMAART